MSPVPSAVPILRVPTSSTLLLPETTSAPELSPCDPIVRVVAVMEAPFSTDSTPVPSSATVAPFVMVSVVPGSVTVTLATAAALFAPSSEPAVTVAPLPMDSAPEPATPTSSRPVTLRLDPAPETLIDEPDPDAVLAITAPLWLATVPPASTDRLPRLVSPTVNAPVVVVSREFAPVTTMPPDPPAIAAIVEP